MPSEWQESKIKKLPSANRRVWLSSTGTRHQVLGQLVRGWLLASSSASDSRHSNFPNVRLHEIHFEVLDSPVGFMKYW